MYVYTGVCVFVCISVCLSLCVYCVEKGYQNPDFKCNVSLIKFGSCVNVKLQINMLKFSVFNHFELQVMQRQLELFTFPVEWKDKQ